MVNRDLDNALQEKLLILTILILADGSMNKVCRGHSRHSSDQDKVHF